MRLALTKNIPVLRSCRGDLTGESRELVSFTGEEIRSCVGKGSFMIKSCVLLDCAHKPYEHTGGFGGVRVATANAL